MARHKKKWRGQRGMLNGTGHGSTAAFVFEIEDTRHWGMRDVDGNSLREQRYNPRHFSYSLRPDYVIQVSDCSRSISLELDFDNDEAIENSLTKIRMLRDGLNDFLKALESEVKLIRKRDAYIQEYGLDHEED